jgi:hypothetical protein
MPGMRLRRRPPRELDADWVQPRWSGRWTTLGILDEGGQAMVDPAGLVTVRGAGWSLDWWIGAEDRWHLPGQETAVRQALIGSSPVVETRVKVPSGDAVQRAYVARAPGGQQAVVVEVENASTVPFAVTLAIRPYDQQQLGTVRSIRVEGTSVLVDGAPALLAARAPGRMALGDASTGDAATAVLGGEAGEVHPATVTCRDGLANVALLYPLAHTAVLRVVLPLDPAAAPADPAAFPTAEQVASGWAAQAAQGARIEVPDRRLREALRVSLRALLLRAADDPAAPAALALLGFGREAARAGDRGPAVSATDLPGAARRALGLRWRLTGDADLAAASIEAIATLLVALAGSDDADDVAEGIGAADDLVALLRAAGEERAAGDVPVALARLRERSAAEPADDTLVVSPRRVLDRARRRIEGGDARTPGDAAAIGDLSTVLDLAGSTHAWPTEVPRDRPTTGIGDGHDLRAHAALVGVVRALLVEELPGPHPRIVLSRVVPQAWLGQGWEVHGAPTAHGRLSYAVRWHDDRPALLWELEQIAGSDSCELTIPGLDPTWSTRQSAGEVLLAPVTIPERGSNRRGLTIPVSIEPMPGRRR